MKGKGPGGHNTIVDKPKNFKKTFKDLLTYLKPYKLAILLVIVIAALSTIFMIVGPKVLGGATTILFEGIMALIAGTGSIDYAAIGKIIITLLILYIISALLAYLEGFIMTRIATKVAFNLREAIMTKIQKLPLKYFDHNNTGEVLSKMTNDVDTINQSLQQGINQLITSVVMVVGILVMMFSISIPLTLVSLLVLPFSAGLMVLMMNKSQKYFSEQQEYLGHLNGHIEEIYGNYNVVKAYNGEEDAKEKFATNNDVLYNSSWKSQFLSGMMFPIMNFISNIGYVLIAVLGGYFATQGKISIGDIQAFIQYVRQFNQPIGQLASIGASVQQTMAAAERVFAFLNEKEEKITAKETKVLTKVKGLVEFKHVHFGYSKDKIVINDLSFKVKPGSKIAIVGPTGAGKTTLVKLLMRFYELNSGSILIDGVNINEIKKDNLRSNIGMVLQDAWLYNASIKENIRYGNLNASDAEVFKAAKLARADHFIHTLPNDYDMVLNEEANNVSQGEKQLITIARAILSDPKILILDEATSSVDTRTEVLIQEAMGKLMEGKTSFIIAHRLSTIRNADLILVMDNGDIVEQGNHEDLLAKDGFYAKLYQSQFENN